MANRHGGWFCGAAADKLAALEALCDKLCAEQEEISAQLEQLRTQGKTRSNKFRELLGQKLINSNAIGLLELHGLM